MADPFEFLPKAEKHKPKLKKQASSLPKVSVIEEMDKFARNVTLALAELNDRVNKMEVNRGRSPELQAEIIAKKALRSAVNHRLNEITDEPAKVDMILQILEKLTEIIKEDWAKRGRNMEIEFEVLTKLKSALRY